MSFRDEARAWIAANLPEDWRGASAESHGDAAYVDIRRQWGRRLHGGGWQGLSWDTAYGGRGLSLFEEAVFAEEMALAGGPDFLNRNAVCYIGPTIIAHGTEAQKRRFLPRILRCDDVWCQGFSEPDAGSDLASLQTSARQTDDGWVVNGQKVWITLGIHADWCYLLARTGEERRHRGISAFCVDMRAPGVTARPITTITGSTEFAEVFFDDVHLPADALLGELNDGWKVAMTTLGFERSINFFARAAVLRRETAELVAEARATGALDDEHVAQRLARCVEDAETLRLVIARHLPQWAATRTPGPEASVIKVLWSEAHQRLMETALEIAPTVAAGRWPLAYLFTRAETIYAGTSEVQRSIIAQRLLELPRA